MRLLRRCVLGCALVLASASGCTLLTSLDGLSGVSEPELPIGDEDRTVDVLAPDGSVDATIADGADGATGPFCASMTPAPTFCSDFDTIPLPAGWDMTSVFGVGSMSVDGIASKSAPKSLLTEVAIAATQGAASLIETLPAPIATALTIDFDVLVESQDGQELNLFNIELRTAAGKTDTVLVRYKNATGAYVKEVAEQPGDAGTLYATTSDIPLAVGDWRHVSLQLTQTASSSAVSLTVDGTTVSKTNLHAHAYPSKPKVQLGIYLPSATVQWRVRFDNFVANLK